jgi:EAL domain-containing protein (putative c-di-GMP-specific phosphodiesterase class I)
MTENPQDMALVTTIISLGHALGCTVVAEGVERADQAQLLRLLGCDQLQGFFFGRPIPADQAALRFDDTHDFAWGVQGESG